MEGSSSFYKSRLCKVIFRVVLLLGFIWFLLIGVVDIQRTSWKAMARSNPRATGFRRHLEVIAGQRHSNNNNNNEDHRRLERLKFVSKRRVPNGPDPIHNRKAGNSNQPPGRSQTVGEAAIKGTRQ